MREEDGGESGRQGPPLQGIAWSCFMLSVLNERNDFI